MRAHSTPPEKLSVAAWVHEPKSGRIMELLTDAPGMQFYTGNFLNGEGGKDGAVYAKHGGFCLETQAFPDAVNQPRFPSSVIAPGRPYLHTMVVRFHTQKMSSSASMDMLPSDQLRGGLSFRKARKILSSLRFHAVSCCNRTAAHHYRLPRWCGCSALLYKSHISYP
jgi:hypothetical protein